MSPLPSALSALWRENRCTALAEEVSQPMACGSRQRAILSARRCRSCWQIPWFFIGAS